MRMNLYILFNLQSHRRGHFIRIYSVILKHVHECLIHDLLCSISINNAITVQSHILAANTE